MGRRARDDAHRPSRGTVCSQSSSTLRVANNHVAGLSGIVNLRVLHLSGDVACVVPGLDGRLVLGQVKAILGATTGMPVLSQRLVLGTDVLSDDAALGDLAENDNTHDVSELTVTLVQMSHRADLSGGCDD